MAALVACVIVAPGLWTAAAKAGTFMDEDARLFTLRWPRAGVFDELHALPDGSVLYLGSDRRLVRLRPSGRVGGIRLAGYPGALAVEPSGSVLYATVGGRVRRLDVDSGAETLVVDLAQVAGFGTSWGTVAIQAITALPSGEIVVADAAARLWAIARDGRVRAVTTIERVERVDRLTPLSRTRILVRHESAMYSIVDLDGAETALASGFADAPLAAGAVLLSWFAPGGTRSLGIVSAEGAITALPRRAIGGLGNGDGDLSHHRADWPSGAMVATADGALVFVHTEANGPGQGSPTYSLRAVAPPSSKRVRVAFAPSAYRTFARGRIGYLAPVGGRLQLELRRAGRVVQRLTATARSPEGELELPTRPRSGAYDLRLRLRTATGASEGRAHVDTRSRLPLREARKAIATAFETRAADEGGGSATAVDTCARVSARRVGCDLRRHSWSNDDFSGDTFARSFVEAHASATLRLDGPFATSTRLTNVPILEPEVHADTDRRPVARPGGEIRIRADIRQPSDARVNVTIWISDRRALTLSAARQFRSPAVWEPRLRLPRQVLTAVRRRARLEMYVKVTAEIPGDPRKTTATYDIGPLTLRAAPG